MRNLKALIALLPSLAFAASNKSVHFQPVAPSPHREGAIGEGLSLGFSVASLVPLQSPFQASIGGENRAFRFQTSTGFGLELAYGITPSLEVGVSSGYESLETRSETGQGLTELATATLKQVPLEAIVRYRMPSTGWEPEAELGAGVGLGTMTLSSTNLSFQGTSESSTPLRGHLAVGAAFPWTEDLSLHFRVGYALQTWSSNTYSTNVVDISRRSLSGLYLNAQLRANF